MQALIWDNPHRDDSACFVRNDTAMTRPRGNNFVNSQRGKSPSGHKTRSLLTAVMSMISKGLQFFGDCFIELLLTGRDFADIVIKPIQRDPTFISETRQQIDQVNHWFSNRSAFNSTVSIWSGARDLNCSVNNSPKTICQTRYLIVQPVTVTQKDPIDWSDDVLLLAKSEEVKLCVLE